MSVANNAGADQAAALPGPGARERLGRAAPYLAVPLLAAVALVAILAQGSSLPTWVTLTVAGLAMGVMLFIMASGLTLVFGLMDVLNFGHGAFITVGAYVGVTVLLWLGPAFAADNVWLNLLAIVPAIAAAMAVAGLGGWFFERSVVAPVYGAHLKQILVTMGALIVTEQLLLAIWGPERIPINRPEALSGAFLVGDAAIERYRVYATVLGLAIFGGMVYVLRRTRVGLLVRAGVENGEMVQAMGYRVRVLFAGVFIVGSALAALGGVMWALYDEVITVHIGQNLMIMVFIVVIIGGLGSVEGCLVGALLVGLMTNYTGFLTPTLSLGSTILLMVVVLMWRPQGLIAVNKGH
ncbi:MAG: branched-chain amino acid ABC transporter permease [Azospirillaceae bacterium]